MDTCRLITTWKCKRACRKCCNHGLDRAEVPSITPTQVARYPEVCITGGEPMLFPDRVRDLVGRLRELNPRQRIYLYTARYQPQLDYLVARGMLTGVQYAIHNPCSWMDAENLLAFQHVISNYPGDFRLWVDQEVETVLAIMPALWKRVQVEAMKDDCPLPPGEELRQLRRTW